MNHINTNQDLKQFILEYLDRVSDLDVISVAKQEKLSPKLNHSSKNSKLNTLIDQINDLISENNSKAKELEDFNRVDDRIKKQKSLTFFLKDYGFDKASEKDHTFGAITFFTSDGKPIIASTLKELCIPFFSFSEKNPYTGEFLIYFKDQSKFDAFCLFLDNEALELDILYEFNVVKFKDLKKRINKMEKSSSSNIFEPNIKFYNAAGKNIFETIISENNAIKRTQGEVILFLKNSLYLIDIDTTNFIYHSRNFGFSDIKESIILEFSSSINSKSDILNYLESIERELFERKFKSNDLNYLLNNLGLNNYNDEIKEKAKSLIFDNIRKEMSALKNIVLNTFKTPAYKSYLSAIKNKTDFTNSGNLVLYKFKVSSKSIQNKKLENFVLSVLDNINASYGYSPNGDKLFIYTLTRSDIKRQQVSNYLNSVFKYIPNNSIVFH